MKRTASYSRWILLSLTGAAVVAATGFRTMGSDRHAVSAPARQSIEATYGMLPLSFEANHGQTDSRVDFISRGNGYSLFLTSGEAVLALRKPVQDTNEIKATGRAKGAVLRMKLVGANQHPAPAAIEELPGKTNYFIGNDPAKWRTDVPNYAKVRYQNVYPGVDLVYYGKQRQLEYDFVVAPGADASAIALDFSGADRRDIDADGNLVLGLGDDDIRLHRPVIYQEEQGIRKKIAGGYVLTDRGQVSFQVAAYDPAKPLVIDPVLSYSTLLGGSSNDLPRGIAVDSLGYAYIAGTSGSTDFPFFGGFDSTGDVSFDVFVAKLNPSASGGASLIYATYLGGATLFVEDQGTGIAVDGSGNAYVTGYTNSNNFPVVNALQGTHNFGVYDAFVSKLNSSGNALLYSTYLGGGGVDKGSAIAVGASGIAYVTGETTPNTNIGAAPFPITATAAQPAYGGAPFCCVMEAFVTKLDTTASGGSSLLYSTFLGGSAADRGTGIAADTSGKAYVVGVTGSANFPIVNGFDTTWNISDGFVAELNTAVSGAAGLVYSTFLGGGDTDQPNDVDIDSLGNAYVAGQTFSTDFPVVNAYSSSAAAIPNAFVVKINPAASGAASLLYSTYLGGSGNDGATGIAVDSNGYAYVTGSTGSSDFPLLHPVDNSFVGGEAFVAKLDPVLSGTSSLLYSTFLGGGLPASIGGSDAGTGIALDAAGNAYVTGYTSSSDFPTVNAYDTTLGDASAHYDAFVAKIDDTPPAASADLSVSKSDSPDPVYIGDNITYTMNVANNGPDAATNVVLTDTLPAGAAFVSASAGCGDVSGTVTCAVGDLANGGTATIQIVVTATTTGTLTNSATVASDVDDPNGLNDSASAQTTVNPAADVSITKSGSPDPVPPGGTVTFTIVVSNSGPSSATGVTVTDPILTGTLQSVTGQGCAQVKAKGKTTVACSVGTLASGANSTITLLVTMPKKQGPTTNTATVTATPFDPNTANNSATGSVTISR